MLRPLVAVLLLALTPAVAGAQQLFESMGSRALGMAGAFVAVANDPSAIHWNPAGLASAGPAAATIEWAQFRNGNQNLAPTPGASLRKSSFASLGTWPIGFSYGTQQMTTLVSGAGGFTGVESLATKEFAATILQSVVEGVVVGSTFKYVRGTLASQLVQDATVAKALDRGADLTGKSAGHFDYDLGVMIDMKKVRLGMTSHNMREPTFTNADGDSLTLSRQSRLGVAVLPTDGLTLAIDMDLDTVDLRDGLRRMIAFGGEERLGSRLVVRGGIRWSLRGPRQQVLATGASFALRPRFWLDAHYTQGHIDGDRGFGAALRGGF